MSRFCVVVSVVFVAACQGNTDLPGAPGGGSGGGSAAGGSAGGGSTGGSGGSGGGSATGGGGASGGGGTGGSGGSGGGAHGGGAAGTLSARYPQDVGISNDPDVIFYSSFENGLAGWTSHTNNPDQIDVLTDAT